MPGDSDRARVILDRHPAHRIHGPCGRRNFGAADLEELDRLAHVLERDKTDRGNRGTSDLARGASNTPRADDLSSSRVARNARGEVHCGTDVVAANLDSGPLVQADPNLGKTRFMSDGPPQREARANGRRTLLCDDHRLVAHHLHDVGSRLQRAACELLEANDEPSSIEVSVRLRERGEAGEIREQEGELYFAHTYSQLDLSRRPRQRARHSELAI